MKRLLILAASALTLAALVPEPADAQGVRGGVRGGARVGGARVGVRPGVRYGRGYGYRPGYVYRRGYGWGPAVGLGVLGAAALGAAVAAPYYGGYADPCIQQQQAYDAWGRPVWQAVRVC